MTKVRCVLVLLGLAASVWAAPYSFECSVSSDVALTGAIAEARVDVEDLGSKLGVLLPEGELGVQVTDSGTSRALPAVASRGENGEVRILWHVPDAIERGTPRRFAIRLAEAAGAKVVTPPNGTVSVAREGNEITISTGLAKVTHDLSRGGMISRIQYADGDERALKLQMNDRLWNREGGAFYLSGDTEPVVTVDEIPGWQATVRVRARYMRGDSPAEGEPAATYEFTYRAGSPFIGVRADIQQEHGGTWDQLHVFELHHTQDYFTHWVEGGVVQSGPLDHPSQTRSLRGMPWGAIINADDALALADTTLYGIHDGLGKYGIYVHGPWINSASGNRTLSATIYAGPSGGSAGAFAKRMAARDSVLTVRYKFPEADILARGANAGLDALSEAAGASPGEFIAGQVKACRVLVSQATAAAERGDIAGWADQLGLAKRLMDRAEKSLRGDQPAQSTLVTGRGADTIILAGSTFLRIGTRQPGGPWIHTLADLHSGKTLVIQPRVEPLWSARLRDSQTGDIVELQPHAEGAIGATGTAQSGQVQMRWADLDLPDEPGSVVVSATVSFEADSPLTRWRINVENSSKRWGLWEVDFPRVAGIVSDGSEALITPSRWGVRQDAAASGSGYDGVYPSAWANMQFLSYEAGGAGLYLAAHDPTGRIKRFSARPDATGSLGYRLTGYPDAMGAPGEGLAMSFDAVIAAHPGNWYDSAKLYRAWVTANASWCSGGPLTTRDDVPQWFKDCALCCRPGGPPEQVMPVLRNLHSAFDMPAVVHWYQWHEIPFDNDYPDYFPTKPGFAEAVTEAENLGLRIMPYINGRLWDSDTKSWADENAAGSVARQLDGEPYFEHWQDQNHGVMCPSTALWQGKMAQVASRIASECGCGGVYLDQIGAARGNLCFATDHGHPVGGAASWVAGEQKLLAGVREAARRTRPDFIMTTEDNAEPYMAQLDGYLMCNAEGPGMVPLFPAVYGGYTLTFGRTGQLDDETAFAMQHGEAFVFGSMMGRISSDAITRPEHAEKLQFLSRLAGMRYEFRDFLAVGEMLRPPTLEGDIPTIGTKFASKSKDYVEMSAIQRAAWRAPDGRLGLFFVNISKEPVEFSLRLASEDYGLRDTVSLQHHTAEGTRDPGPSLRLPQTIKLSLPPWSAQATVVTTAN